MDGVPPADIAFTAHAGLRDARAWAQLAARCETLGLAGLERPRALRQPVPLLIGGNGPRVLRYAARHADVVGLSGLGRTLPDGHEHTVQWQPAQIDERLALVHDAAAAAGRRPLL